MRGSLNWIVGVVMVIAIVVIILDRNEESGGLSSKKAAASDQERPSAEQARSQSSRRRATESVPPSPPPLTKEDKALALAQKLCVVCREDLSLVERPYKVTVYGQVLFTCSAECKKHLLKYPELFVAKPQHASERNEGYEQLDE